MPMKRTIAAILAADVAGYSRLIAEDEDDTLTRLAEYTAVFRAEVTAVGGRIFNTAGDAILAEFPSAVEALRAAIAIQERLRMLNRDYPAARKVQFRMGLTIGDVVETDTGDMLGDGVNVAARLEGIAEPGGICISRSVHEAIAARLAVAFRDIGPQRLKNIPRPVHAFRVVLPSEDAAGTAQGRRMKLPLRVKAMAALLAATAVLGGLGLAYRLGLFDGAEDPEAASSASAAREAPDRTDLLTVGVANPRRTCFRDEIWLSGILQPRREVEVGPDAEGLRVLRVLAKPMDVVGSGHALAELARPEQPDQAVATLRAPVAGTVGASTASVGSPTSFRAPPLFRIIANGDLELAAEVPMSALDRLVPGQSTAVTPLGSPEVTGRVRSVSSDIDGATQLGRARILLRTNAELRPGTFARGVVTVGERCGLAVPASSILRSAEGNVVYVSNDGRIEGRLVSTGLSSGHDVEIRGGLEESDAVVVRAAPFVREGDVVKPRMVAAGTD